MEIRNKRNIYEIRKSNNILDINDINKNKINELSPGFVKINSLIEDNKNSIKKSKKNKKKLKYKVNVIYIINIHL